MSLKQKKDHALRGPYWGHMSMVMTLHDPYTSNSASTVGQRTGGSTSVKQQGDAVRHEYRASSRLGEFNARVSNR